MSKILVPARCAYDWKPLLADPKHWKKAHSACTLAFCWQEADGFPKSVRDALRRSGLGNLKVILAIPEWKVPLRGGPHPSQNDIFVLAKDKDGLVVIMVEGKVQETFGPTVGDWNDGSDRKKTRFEFLVALLGITGDFETLAYYRYQFFHRASSALLEADRFGAARAIMLVHSFSQAGTWFEDYQKFASLLGVQAEKERITSAGLCSGKELYLGWVTGEEKYLHMS